MSAEHCGCCGTGSDAPASAFNGVPEHVNMDDLMPVSRISIVDDDISVREALPDLLRQFGFEAKTFPSAEAFLDSNDIEANDCLILDVSMPGMSGPELKAEIERRGYNIPTVFITAHGDIAFRPDMRDGTATCLVKPFTDTALLEALRKAMSRA